MSVDKNLPPELVDRINTSKRRCFSGSGIIPKTEKAYTPASVHTGGWMPYTSITRNGGARMSSESRLVSRAAALTNNPSVMHTSETAHWLNRNAVNIFTSQFFSHLITFGSLVNITFLQLYRMNYCRLDHRRKPHGQ